MAFSLAQKAREVRPNDPSIADTLGWALYRRGAPADLKRAEELLQSARGKLTSPTSKYHLGATLIALGKTAEGKTLLQQALASSSDFPEAEQARRMLGQRS